MLGLDFKVVSAIFRKDMRVYLGNPTGYVFITLFIAATSAAAFLQEEFFSRNLADLATLNAVMPIILMFFVPAITMNAWADERRAGTDELLLTLPLRDGEVVLGKYLGVLGMYTLSLALTAVSQLTVLAVLGEPDKGLMFATFAGYWLMGALFAAIGLLASMLTLNTTVAFILGALGCLGLVLAGALPWASALVGIVVCALVVMLVWYAVRGSTDFMYLTTLAVIIVLGAVRVFGRLSDSSDSSDGGAAVPAEGEAAVAEPGLADRFADAFGSLSVDAHFSSFGEGVIRLGDVLYFAGGVVFLLYLCAFLLGRRHW